MSSLNPNKLVNTLRAIEASQTDRDDDGEWWAGRSVSEEYQTAYNNITNRLSLTKESIVGEFCCGTGEILIRIHGKGIKKAIGIDRSTAMLERAMRNLEKRGIPARIHEAPPKSRKSFKTILNDSKTIDLFIDDAIETRFVLGHYAKNPYFSHVLHVLPQVALSKQQAAFILSRIPNADKLPINFIKNALDAAVNQRIDYNAYVILKAGGYYTHAFYDYGLDDAFPSDLQTLAIYPAARKVFNPAGLKFFPEPRVEQDLRRFNDNLKPEQPLGEGFKDLSYGYMVRTWKKKEGQRVSVV
ncbi:class I SAM-dependent methyltransferase [Candidatus Woesearchaeota archaeon]|nr:class I SAM-dependent methyltransferase [Candidatus Woesearchaeota archaeon]